MSNIKVACYAAVLLLSPAFARAADAAPACDPWAAKIVSLQGKVETKRAKATDWQAASLNAVFCSGDTIRVGDNSRAAIVLANETLLRLDQRSAITLTAVSKDAPSILDMLTGLVHFISRVPHSLKVNTPYVNAAIEGTEFVVAVDKGQGSVTVFEGKVLAQNAAGEVRITHNETATAKAGEAPQKILLAKPRDAVQWALYYPPIFAANDPLAPAANLLYRGRVEEARQQLKALPAEQANSGKAKALEAIIAVVQNDKGQAIKLADEAVKQSPDVAATHIALSYAQQAQFELDAATQSAARATTTEPNNALAFARLAELQLSRGYLNDALVSAQHAVQLDAKQARAHTILGFAYLTQIHITEATQTFTTAIELDQADPLPRLGLGLAKIRKNELADGRREIEIAAMLDPNNALVRSYLGKAYFEEKRAPLDADQFAMAKELDPNDPTPWFYDAIRKQTENRPVEALNDLQKSIELNDNRAVYRSRLQLDQDEAARSASLARVYSDLGFEQLALIEGWRSLQVDPSNHSAHRFLADNYISLPNHEIGRLSELLQSQLWQPLSLTPLQPQLTQSGIKIVEGLGPSNTAYQEYMPLFTRNQVTASANLLVGGDNTIGDDFTVSGLYNRFAISAGQYHYETDGYRPNSDQKQNQQNVFVQYAISPQTSVQVEYRNFSSDEGDLALRADPANFSTAFREQNDTESWRLGLRHDFSNQSKLIFSYITQDYTLTQHTAPQSNQTIDAYRTKDPYSVETQLLYLFKNLKVIVGLGNYVMNTNTSITTSLDLGFPFGIITANASELSQDSHLNGYIYTGYQLQKDLFMEMGVSADDYEGNIIDKNQFNPKFGLTWHATENGTIRLAAFQALKRDLVTNQTIEPTQIAGFNQFFDDDSGASSKRFGIAWDQLYANHAFSGIEISKREISHPYRSSGITYTTNWEDRLYRLYHYWPITNYLASTTEYSYTRQDFGYAYLSNGVRKSDTHRLPLSISYFPDNSFTVKVAATYTEQQASLYDITTFIASQHNNNFWTVDTELNYRLPKRAGKLSLGIYNILNEKIQFQEPDPNNPTLYPEQFVYTKINLNF